MAKMLQGNYASPKVQIVLCTDDIVRTSDGSVTGEGLMLWSEGWGGVTIGGNE